MLGLRPARRGQPTGRALDTAFARRLLDTARQAVDICRRELALLEEVPALNEVPAEFGGVSVSHKDCTAHTGPPHRLCDRQLSHPSYCRTPR